MDRQTLLWSQDRHITPLVTDTQILQLKVVYVQTDISVGGGLWTLDRHTLWVNIYTCPLFFIFSKQKLVYGQTDISESGHTDTSGLYRHTSPLIESGLWTMDRQTFRWSQDRHTNPSIKSGLWTDRHFCGPRTDTQLL